MLIGFIGAPCCGKSTTAFGLCHYFKTQGHAVEFIPEYARRHIMETRIKGGVGNGGPKGQHFIYTQDSDNALLYRDHSQALCITDGSTLNCHFYDYPGLDLVEEAAKYDLLFYVPIGDVPPTKTDSNRVQNRQESMELAQRWDDTIRPLIGTIPHIVELRGYPYQTAEAMLTEAVTIIEEKLRRAEKAQASLAAIREEILQAA